MEISLIQFLLMQFLLLVESFAGLWLALLAQDAGKRCRSVIEAVPNARADLRPVALSLASRGARAGQVGLRAAGAAAGLGFAAFATHPLALAGTVPTATPFLLATLSGLPAVISWRPVVTATGATFARAAVGDGPGGSSWLDDGASSLREIGVLAPVQAIVLVGYLVASRVFQA